MQKNTEIFIFSLAFHPWCVSCDSHKTQAQENRIVLTQITEGILDSRPDFTHKFQLGHGDQGFVVRRIGFVWRDAEDIGAGLVGNDLPMYWVLPCKALMSLPSGSEK